MDNDTPREFYIDRRVEEICAKVVAGTVTDEERQEMRTLTDERIERMTLPLQPKQLCPHCGK